MTREDIRLVASILAGSEECRAWVRTVESLDHAHEVALNWGVENTPADTDGRRAIVRFATGCCGAAAARVPANVLDRIENLVHYYRKHDYDPTREVPGES